MNLTPFGPPSFPHLRFRLAIKQQLGRKLGPRKIGWPKENAIETGDLLEVDSDRCFTLCENSRQSIGRCTA